MKKKPYKKIMKNVLYEKNINSIFSKLFLRKKKEIYICLTIDTESGYTNKDNSISWHIQKPNSFQGYVNGIKNWTKILDKYNVPGTFLLDTHCFSAPNKTRNEIKKILKETAKKHEIGFHLHPKDDLALKKSLPFELKYNDAKYYTKNNIESMIRLGRKIIKKEIKVDAKSFRWGNWSLNSTAAVKSLEKSGILIDSSAIPNMKNQNKDYSCDWSKVKRCNPWFLNLKDYQKINEKNSNVLEIPVSTVKLFNSYFRADPKYGFLLLYFLHKFAHDEKSPKLFVINTHSSEANYKNGKPTKMLDCFSNFIKKTAEKNSIQYVTLTQAKKTIVSSENESN